MLSPHGMNPGCETLKLATLQPVDSDTLDLILADISLRLLLLRHQPGHTHIVHGGVDLEGCC